MAISALEPHAHMITPNMGYEAASNQEPINNHFFRTEDDHLWQQEATPQNV